MNFDRKIDEILSKFRKNNGEIKVSTKFKMYYNQNESVFRQMIDEYKLITPNIQGKMSLTKLGREVCKKHGWKHYNLSNLKQAESRKKTKIKKRIIAATIAIVVALTPLILKECSADSQASALKQTTDSQISDQNP